MIKINSIFEELCEVVDKTRVFCNEPMKKHTTIKIGGVADFYVIAQSIEEVKWVLEVAKKNMLPVTVVGNGSNLLVLDGGIRGITLRVKLDFIEIDDDIITVGAGAMLNIVSKKALNNNLTGLEFVYGIPGTIGGAIRMNAGAYGCDMKEIVQETTYITKDGLIKTISGDEHEFTYRNSIFSRIDVIILSAKLKLQKGNKDDIEEKMKHNIENRRIKHPVDMPNAGSIFKRGNGFITAQLIEGAGLRGYTIGGAEVSTKHVGFIVNKGNATAEDVLKLAEYVKQEVYKKYEKNIELEIIVVGDKN